MNKIVFSLFELKLNVVFLIFPREIHIRSQKQHMK